MNLENEIKNLVGKINETRLSLNGIDEELKKLEINPIVKEYIFLRNRQEELKKDLNSFSSELLEIQMNACEHIFVCTSKNKSNSYDMRSYPILHCVKCGLTNHYDITDTYNLTPYQIRLGKIFNKSSHRGVTIGGIHEDLDFIKRTYKGIRSLNSQATNIEIASLLKKAIDEHDKKKEI